MRCSLPYATLHYDPDVLIRAQNGEHRLWVVVTQNCDLVVAETSDEAMVELRPVFHDAKSRPRGIRSRELVLRDNHPFFLSAQSTRIMVSPAALAAIAAQDETALENPLADHELVRLKTWLGLRYDRPAVPEDIVGLGRQIASAVKTREKNPVVHGIRDILWQYEPDNPPRFSLFAVLDEGVDQQAAREWLTTVAMEVPIEVGIADEIEVRDVHQTSLHLIETSYSADASDITWRGGTRKRRPRYDTAGGTNKH